MKNILLLISMFVLHGCLGMPESVRPVAGFELDRDNYEYAFVSGPSTKYLWLLSRTPSVKKEVVEKFIELSSSRGFDTDNLIFVQHD